MPTAAPAQAKMKPVPEVNFSLFSTILLLVESIEVPSHLSNNRSNISAHH
jgi:hypothetical protein